MHFSFLTVNKPETKVVLKNNLPGTSLSVNLSSGDGGLANLLYSVDDVNYQPASATVTSPNGTIYLDTKNSTPNTSLLLTSAGLKEVIWGKDVIQKRLCFLNCTGLVKVPGFLWKNCTSLESMFEGASTFNQNINSWDTSKVLTFQSMFEQAKVFNQPLNNWNTGAATNMFSMFYGAANFNQNLSGWNVSKVTNRSNFDTGTTAWLSVNKPKFV